MDASIRNSVTDAQTRVDDQRPRTNLYLDPSASMPIDSRQARRFLRTFVERKSKTHSFTYTINPGESEGHSKDPSRMLRAVDIRNIPTEIVEDITSAEIIASSAWKKYGKMYVQDEQDIQMIWHGAEGPACWDCPAFSRVEGWGPSCLPVSYSWHDPQDYVDRYYHHKIVVETRQMEMGTDMHEKLIMMQNLEETLNGFFRKAPSSGSRLMKPEMNSTRRAGCSAFSHAWRSAPPMPVMTMSVTRRSMGRSLRAATAVASSPLEAESTR